MKRIGILAGVSAMIILLSACSTEYDNLVQQSQEIVDTAVQETAAAATVETEPPQETKLFSMNEMATFGDYGVTATKTKVHKEDQTNSIQVIVTVKNLGKQPIQIDSSYFNLIDGEERQFDPTAKISLDMDNGISGSFLMETINPGLSLQRSVFFDVPQDVTSAKLSMRDNMFDFGGAKYVFIDLGQLK